jgi:hypothetical protein
MKLFLNLASVILHPARNGVYFIDMLVLLFHQPIPSLLLHLIKVISFKTAKSDTSHGLFEKIQQYNLEFNQL